MFRATSPGGTSLASDKDYVAAMTASQVIGAGGVGQFDAIQLRNVLSGKAGVRDGRSSATRTKGWPAARLRRTWRRCSS